MPKKHQEKQKLEKHEEKEEKKSGGKISETMSKIKKEFEGLASSVEERIEELKEREKQWALMEQQMEAHAADAANKIILDVGGTRFAAAKTTLLSKPGSFFEAMLSSGKWKPDADGSYFIDRNPELFAVILDYLRTGKVNLKRLNYDATEDLMTEFDFFSLDFPDSLLFDSKLLNPQQKQQLLTWAGKKSTTLLYVASRDGFTANVFHSKCDNKGPTLSIFRSSSGYVFGGYSSANWDGSNQQRSSPGAFLFTITNAYNMPFTQFSSSNPSIMCYGGYLQVFGNSYAYDLCISSNANTSNSSSSFPNVYQDSPQYGYGAALFGGSSFTISEIEVFLVQ